MSVEMTDARVRGAAVRLTPLIAASAALIVGAINLASSVTPELPGGVQGLLTGESARAIEVFQGMALPAGLIITALSWQLWRRSRPALHLAISLLVLSAGFNFGRGHDIGEAGLSIVLAGLLWSSRDAFCALRGPVSMRRGSTPPLVILGIASLAAVAADPLLGGPFAFGVALGGAAVAIFARYMTAPAPAPGDPDRARAARHIAVHGIDTLSSFKLRTDLERRWSSDGRALAAFRVHAGTLLIAGDPVGPPDAVQDLIAELASEARVLKLRFAMVGVSESVGSAARGVGMRTLYMGDEALVACGEMDLSGGQRKSLRKAVNRLTRNGYMAELVRAGDLDDATYAHVRRVGDAWRGGQVDRGFSLAHHTVRDPLLPDAVVAIARDGAGIPRAYLHLAPTAHKGLYSVGRMARERDTPNGLMDFLVVETARMLGEHGGTSFSLNFATFGRWLRSPSGLAQRAAARGLRLLDRWLQIERLLRFNEKFDPAWQPRVLVIESWAGFPRAALATMLAEGQFDPQIWRGPSAS